MSKQLSLIILTYNSEKDIYDCLRSVYQYNDIADALEIIVVDNNSTNFDTMRQKLQTKYPEVIVLKNDKNGGYGQGNNIGINAATAPFVAIMNPDVRLFMPVFALFINTLSHENVVMCGGKQYASEKQKNASFLPDFTITALQQSLIYHFKHHFDKYDYKSQWLQGAFFAIKKDIFQHIGLFDENIFMYAEEFDIHLRLRKTYPNSKIVYLPNAKYLHLTAERPFSENTIKAQYNSDIYVCKKHGYDPAKMLSRMLHAAYFTQFFSRIILGKQAIDPNFKRITRVLREYINNQNN